MKRLFFTICFFLMVISLYARGIREEADLSEEIAMASYSIGMVFGMEISQIGMELDYEAFKKGFVDILEGHEPQLSIEEANEIVQIAFEKAFEQQTKKLQLAEEEFLAANGARPEIQTTESGLQYTVLEEGSGPKPTIEDIVRVNYEGATIAGAVFDSTYERGEPEEISLDTVIPGWAEGVMLMNVGSKYRFYLPSYLAYGERGVGQIIPPYSTLVFTIDLMEIIEEEEYDLEEEAEEEATESLFLPRPGSTQ